MDKIYKKPALIEAIWEFQFRPSVELDNIEKVRNRLREQYPHAEEMKNYNVNIDFDGGRANIINEFLGIRLFHNSGTRICQLRTNGISFSQLAPYIGWKEFLDDILFVWEKWENVNKSINRISRIGLRYINRFDIPVDSALLVDPDLYLKVGVRVPQPPLPHVADQSMRIQGKLADDSGADFAINCGRVPSPLIGHVSFVLDIDVSKSQAIPSDEENLWALIGMMRDSKNFLFESSITDEARKSMNG